MANMLSKHAPYTYACPCSRCSKKAWRRKGRKSVRRKEEQQWQRDHEKNA